VKQLHEIEQTQTVMKVGSFFLENRFNNLSTLAKSKPLESLRCRYKDKAAIIVASGPSLSKNIEHLLSVKKRALIIATDSAVVPLINKGIMPDYIATVDFRDFTYKKLEPVKHLLSNSYLLMIAESTPKIANEIKFKGIYYATQNDKIAEMLEGLLCEKTTVLINATAVTHLGLIAAQVFGCSPIIFTGLDLAFYKNQDHAGGTVLNGGNNIVENSDSLYVKGINGRLTHTGPGYIVQKEICEQLISTNPGLRYIDATEGGAKIQGTEVDKLVNVLNELDSNIIDIIKYEKNKPDYSSILSNLESLKKELVFLNRMIMQYNKSKKNIQKYLKSLNNFNTPWKSKKLRKMDKINTLLNNNKAMMYSKELLCEYHNEFLRHNEKIEGILEKDSLLERFNQQIFVQKIRRKAINTFLRLVNQQIEIFKKRKL